MDRYSFITEDFHFIFLAGLSGAPRMLGEGLQGKKASWLVRDGGIKLTPFPEIAFAAGSVFQARSTCRDGAHLLGWDIDDCNWDEAAYEDRWETVLNGVNRAALSPAAT